MEDKEQDQHEYHVGQLYSSSGALFLFVNRRSQIMTKTPKEKLNDSGGNTIVDRNHDIPVTSSHAETRTSKESRAYPGVH